MGTIVIVGGGPAGLFAALTAAEVFQETGEKGNHRILVVEKMKRPGRKLLLTGAGQCNLTRREDPPAFLDHYGGKGAQGRFLKRALYAFPPESLVRFFEDRGVALLDNGKGKLFPRSGRAADVLESLLSEGRLRGVEILTGRGVTGLDRGETEFILTLADGTALRADRVILAAGGRSYPGTGSSGDGYTLAGSLGHSVVDPRPALIGVETEPRSIGALAGVSFHEIAMTLRREGRKILTAVDDMVITHTGFSGPVVLNNSREIRPGDELVFDFSGRGETFTSLLKEAAAAGGKRSLSGVVAGMGIPKRLIQWCLEDLGLDGGRRSVETGKKEVQALAESLCRGRFRVVRLGGWNEAMVTAGGIPLGEIQPATLESRRVPGLYFAGEVMDVDGDTGGYNLQAAFSTGYLSGRSAAIALTPGEEE